MKSLCAVTLMVAGLAALVMAAPPGPLDGENIPSNFGAGNLVATQTNYTQFGDYSVETGALLPGSETDELYLAKSGGKLYVGITGNLETNGHGWMIGVGIPGRVGQTEDRAEAVGGPPFTFQTAGRTVEINTNGTPEDATDDTWTYDENGTILPCETDFVVAVDAFGGTMSVSEYELLDPSITPTLAGTWDPTPDNPGDPEADLFALRTFVTQGPTDDLNDVMESDQGFGYEEGGFDNSNVMGVTDVDGSSAATATTGMELGIPLSRLGGLAGNETIELYVLLMDGVEEGTGTVTNQVLPPVTGSAFCDPPAAIGLRPDLSAVMGCLSVNLATLPAFTGTAEGLIDASEYGGSAVSTQTCPTPYGDQQFDPTGITRGGGSELNEMYVTSDGVNVYIGLTGNLEENGNKLNIWFDNDIGTDGDNPLVWDNMDPDGMEGDIMPPFPADPTGPRPLYDYAVSINIGGDGPNNPVFVDLWDLTNQVSTYKGLSDMESGNGDLAFGANQWNMQVALNNLNNVGVIGCGPAEDPCNGAITNESWFDDDATVAALAAGANNGFEIAVPLIDLGIDPCAEPATVHLWAHVTGSGGWRSNQSLPTQRFPTCFQTQNAGNLVTDWYNPNAPCGPSIFDYYRSGVVTVVHTPGVENDCNTNGVEDQCEVLGGADDCNTNGIPDECELVDNDCNTNLVPDDCDIADGTSLDVNTNGIPDECEEEPAIIAAESCIDHLEGGSFMERCLTLVDESRALAVEMRLESIKKLVVTLDSTTLPDPLTASIDCDIWCNDDDDCSAGASCVGGLCDNSGPIGGVSVSAGPGADQATITVDPAVPGNSCCVVSMDGVGNTRNVRALAGDVNQDGIVNTLDFSAIKARFGQLTDGTNFQWDVKTDGVINSIDFSAVKARFGNNSPDCP